MEEIEITTRRVVTFKVNVNIKEAIERVALDAY